MIGRYASSLATGRPLTVSLSSSGSRAGKFLTGRCRAARFSGMKRWQVSLGSVVLLAGILPPVSVGFYKLIWLPNLPGMTLLWHYLFG